MPGSGTSVPVVVPLVVLPVEVVELLVEVVDVVEVLLVLLLHFLWPQVQVWVCQPLVDEEFDQVAEAGTAAVRAARAAPAIRDLRSIVDPLWSTGNGYRWITQRACQMSAGGDHAG
jgi:hypothetical protein